MGTYCVTGSASGIGQATKKRLEADGHRVIGVDLRNADVNVDLGTVEGRRQGHEPRAVRGLQRGAAALDGIEHLAVQVTVVLAGEARHAARAVTLPGRTMA